MREPSPIALSKPAPSPVSVESLTSASVKAADEGSSKLVSDAPVENSGGSTSDSPVALALNATQEKPAVASLPWWRDFKHVVALPPLITALVTGVAGLSSVATTSHVEQSKLQAQAKDRENQRQAEQNLRQDKNSADERALRTKYVDLALNPCLGVDHSVRVFGYLATVLTDPMQKQWAQTELKSAEDRRAEVRSLKQQLDKKRADSISYMRDQIVQASTGTKAQWLVDIIGRQQKTANDEIESLRKRIAEAEGDNCSQKEVPSVPPRP